MNLHNHKEEFKQLINIVANYKNIPESAVERDYYIVQALSFLSKSEYAERCIFKGGTSLSKCFPNTIERFSEDIDLTYIPEDGMTDKQIERKLKQIETIMTADAFVEKIESERNERNKSMWFWYGDNDSRIKLEIGSSVRPEPYSKKTLKCYIQEYLESIEENNYVKEYQLGEVKINVLNIERTFVDKIMAVKRHSMCGNITAKSRHIYDVVKLYDTLEIKNFIANKDELKRLIKLTKDTDSKYLEKRNIPKDYNPVGPYDFNLWEDRFIEAQASYEKLHEDLLYTGEKQNFDVAISVFKQINEILKEIGE